MRLGNLTGVALTMLTTLVAALPLAGQRDTLARDPNVLAAAATSTPASARSHGRIVGVFDDESGNPIADAEVIDLFTGGTAHTETHGLVELSQFQQRNDSAAVRIRKIGYADTSFIVMVGAADTVPVQVTLSKAAIDLPALISHATPVETARPESPLLADFNFRRKMGFGHFMDGLELRKYADGHPFADYLVSHFPSLTIKFEVNGDETMATTRGGCSGPVMRCGTSGLCPVAIYVDGSPVYVPGKSANKEDFRNYKPEEFAAVEFYASGATLPTEYGGTGGQCGALLLWRRYR